MRKCWGWTDEIIWCCMGEEKDWPQWCSPREFIGFSGSVLFVKLLFLIIGQKFTFTVNFTKIFCPNSQIFSFFTNIFSNFSGLWPRGCLLTFQAYGHEGGLSLLDGGFGAWTAHKLPIEVGKQSDPPVSQAIKGNWRANVVLNFEFCEVQTFSVGTHRQNSAFWTAYGEPFPLVAARRPAEGPIRGLNFKEIFWKLLSTILRPRRWVWPEKTEAPRLTLTRSDQYPRAGVNPSGKRNFSVWNFLFFQNFKFRSRETLSEMLKRNGLNVESERKEMVKFINCWLFWLDRI